MSTCPDVVSASVDLRLIVPGGQDRLVRADLSYAPNDPYAVGVAFHTGTPALVEWTFARSLLTEGVTQPAGIGDVQVWSTRSGERPRICIALSSPTGRALFDAPLGAIVEFLSETYALVPTGCESEFLDVDAGLAELLGGSDIAESDIAGSDIAGSDVSEP
ncbi:MAG TPA: SsgA family sporulation/cell division regulator [Mycobacteriales bacterium]|jgi:hypothetical protein|nr:SsgA family sporulation/cell division regulator [Mycobacteriales bacterium]